MNSIMCEPMGATKSLGGGEHADGNVSRGRGELLGGPICREWGGGGGGGGGGKRLILFSSFWHGVYLHFLTGFKHAQISNGSK